MLDKAIQTLPKIYFPEVQTSPLTWLEIDRNGFDHNIQLYKKEVAPSLLAVVVKSNAYGHGIEHIAVLAQKNDNVDYICTVSLSEAIFLRKEGIKKPILVLSILNDGLEQAFMHDIDLVVYDMQQALALHAIGVLLKQKINVHIKVDTGLSRLGVIYYDAISFIKKIYQLPYVTVQGLFTHFAESEKADRFFTQLQIERFKEIVDSLEKEKIIIPLKHASCSAAITAYLKSHFTMARVGIGAYGLWPSADNKKLTQEQNSLFSLNPILTWKTKIVQLKDISAGSYIGYNRTHCVTRNSRIATLPVGYWDGYDRKLSNKSFVIINNQQAPLVGVIAMNLMMADVTGLDVKINDEVILLGNYEGITADALAHRCDTINYEFVTRINPLLPRMVKD